MPTSPTHCSDYREKPPELTKAKEKVVGRKIGCHIHRSSLDLCSVVQYYTHSTHFWFEPDSCFWSAALHITGRKWERWISQDVKGEKWRKTPPFPPPSTSRNKKKKKKRKTPKHRAKTNTKINKSTIGAAAEKGNIGKNCSGEILNCRCINNLATWDTVFFVHHKVWCDRELRLGRLLYYWCPGAQLTSAITLPTPKQCTAIPFAKWLQHCQLSTQLDC